MLAQLTRGLSPRRAALALALGAWLGLVPILGATIGLCLLAGALLRLNHAVLQAANLLVYPLQLILLIPFLNLGAWAFGSGPLNLDLSGLPGRMRSAPWAVLREYGWIGLRGCAVWAGLGLLAVPALWWIFERLFTRMAAGLRKDKTQATQNP
ncbi:MAG TPA: DUF2062 domain-containing protein [bacterium]|nr:DUF2062 domain-containing protein [bacterium]